jgi:signal transduction histidine kinase
MKVFHTDHLTGILGKISHIAVRVRRKFWWIDVIYPIALAALIFACLTYIVYSGRESTRLSLLGERFLLEQSLRQTPYFSMKYPHELITVSIDPVKMSLPERSHLGLTPDVTVEVYGKIIEALSQKGLKNIIVIWRSENHPQDSLGYEYLREVLSKIKNNVNTIFVTNLSENNGIKSFIGDITHVVDNIPCANANIEELQTYCPIVEQNQEWIAQWLYKRFFKPARHGEGPTRMSTSWLEKYVIPSWKTRYIPSTVEGYITQMTNPESLKDYSVQDVLKDSFKVPNYTSTAFVGVDLSGIMGSHIHPPMPIGITIPSGLWESKTNISLHKYWASMTQSFIEEKIPTVGSPLMVWVLNIMVCCAVIVCMFRVGGMIASCVLVVWYLVAPILNVIFLTHANFYIPLFNSYYFGLSFLTFSGFARLSYTALNLWRAEEKSRSLLHAADLKANFISLLSHNINTPIAKMQGMLDLLLMGDLRYFDSEDLFQARFYLAQLQLVIKSVLVGTTLEEKGVVINFRHVNALLEDFHNGFDPLIRQLGVDLEIRPILVEHEDLLYLPLCFDSRVLSTALAAIIGLGASLERRPGNIEVDIAENRKKNRHMILIPLVTEELDQIKIIFVIEIKDAGVEQIQKWFSEAQTRNNGLRGVQSEDFVRGVLSGFVMLSAEFYGGTVKVEISSEDPCNIEVTIELVSFSR